jgi:amidase
VAPVEQPSPFGVTFSGRAFSEPTLIALAHAFEQATHHRRAPESTPPLSTDVVKR